MKKTEAMKEMIIVRKLKAEDAIELPMDEMFFDDLHNKIMMSVEKTEVKPVSKLAKTWIFLESQTHKQAAKLKKATKYGVTALTLALGVSLVNFCINWQSATDYAQANLNSSAIVSEAQKSPLEWSEMAGNYQNESDFYADILSQRDTETMVEIDKVIAQSL
jgi:hypothetical protein